MRAPPPEQNAAGAAKSPPAKNHHRPVEGRQRCGVSPRQRLPQDVRRGWKSQFCADKLSASLVAFSNALFRAGINWGMNSVAGLWSAVSFGARRIDQIELVECPLSAKDPFMFRRRQPFAVAAPTPIDDLIFLAGGFALDESAGKEVGRFAIADQDFVSLLFILRLEAGRSDSSVSARGRTCPANARSR